MFTETCFTLDVIFTVFITMGIFGLLVVTALLLVITQVNPKHLR